MLALLQDGSERMLESLSLIDAVMPEVVEARKSVPKNQQNKGETVATNGDGDASAASKFITSYFNVCFILCDAPSVFYIYCAGYVIPYSKSRITFLLFLT